MCYVVSNYFTLARGGRRLGGEHMFAAPVHAVAAHQFVAAHGQPIGTFYFFAHQLVDLALATRVARHRALGHRLLGGRLCRGAGQRGVAMVVGGRFRARFDVAGFGICRVVALGFVGLVLVG